MSLRGVFLIGHNSPDNQGRNLVMTDIWFDYTSEAVSKALQDNMSELTVTIGASGLVRGLKHQGQQYAFYPLSVLIFEDEKAKILRYFWLVVGTDEQGNPGVHLEQADPNVDPGGRPLSGAEWLVGWFQYQTSGQEKEATSEQRKVRAHQFLQEKKSQLAEISDYFPRLRQGKDGWYLQLPDESWVKTSVNGLEVAEKFEEKDGGGDIIQF